MSKIKKHIDNLTPNEIVKYLNGRYGSSHRQPIVMMGNDGFVFCDDKIFRSGLSFDKAVELLNDAD